MPERKTEEGDGGGDSVPGCSPSFRDAEKQVFGCEHYKRNCKLLATCCNKLFTCRFCHDKVSDHTMDRYFFFLIPFMAKGYHFLFSF